MDFVETTPNGSEAEVLFEVKLEDSIVEETVQTASKAGDARAFLESLLKLMGKSCTLDERAKNDEVCFYIKGSEASSLIGYRGETLDAFQHLATQISKLTGGNCERVVVDADFYRQKREATLTGLARKLAKKADATGRPVELEPMNAAERRIIHSALQDSRIATTHSEGEGRDRHVVIAPVMLSDDAIEYGTSEFKKKGPSKMRSFGQKKRRF